MTKTPHRIDLSWLLSEKQIPQVVENLEGGGKAKEALERNRYAPKGRCATRLRYGPTLYCHDSKSLDTISSQRRLRRPCQSRDKKSP